MSNVAYHLRQPLLDWEKGEIFTFDAKWGEWIRESTGETFDYRGSIGEGEKAMLLNYAKDNLPTVIELWKAGVLK